MSLLNQTQIAALQQMGLCVWQTPANTASAPIATATTVPVAKDRAGHLAALRSTLANSATAKTSPTTIASEQQAPESVLPASHDQANSKERRASAATPLTREQLTRFCALVEDIEQAIQLVTGDLSPITIMVGQRLQFTHREITLPVSPEELTATHKRQLWQLLGQTA